MIALLMLSAFAAGLVDAVAGGGGLITLPSLLAAGLSPHAALATNKGQSTFGTMASFATFARKGRVDRSRAIIGFGMAFLGSLAGALLLLQIRPEPLKPAILILLTGMGMVVGLRGRVRPERVAIARSPFLAAALGFTLGAYDGFFGPGVGTMIVVVFMLTYGDNATRASANAKAINLASNIAAFILFGSRGLINWRIALPMAASGIVGASIGARLALKRGDQFVRILLLGVLSSLVLKLGYELWSTRSA